MRSPIPDFPISIHALRVEGDELLVSSAAFTGISIHALRVEGDEQIMRSACDYCRFLSTPSGWRATTLKSQYYGLFKFLSTPSGWRATRDGKKKDGSA